MKGFRLIQMAAVVGLMLAIASMAAPKAAAGYEVIPVTATVPSGSASIATTVTMSRSLIKDLIATVPTLDSGDASTITLRVVYTASSASAAATTYTPRSWTDKGISSSGDGAIVLCNSSALDVLVDSEVVITFTCATNQAAARTITYRIGREY